MIAENIIIGWPGAEVSIPAGRSRVTEMDSKYIRFIPDSETEPGDTGDPVVEEAEWQLQKE